MHMLRYIGFAVMIWAGGFAVPGTSMAEDGIHRLALQISDNDAAKMATVLNVAANVSRHYSEIGEEV